MVINWLLEYGDRTKVYVLTRFERLFAWQPQYQNPSCQPKTVNLGKSLVKDRRFRTLKRSKFTRIVLLSLIAVVQMLTIIGGFFAYEQMSDMLWKLRWDYKKLLEKTGDLIIDYGPNSNPFAPLLPLVLLGLFLTIVLLVDEIFHKPELNTLEACSPPSPN